MGEFFSLGRFWGNIPQLIAKFPVTLEIVSVAFSAGFVLAIAIALVELKKVPVASQLLKVFISFERSTPLLVQMLVVYYGLPMLLLSLGVDIRRWEKLTFVIITYTLNQGAFLGEYFRSAILSVPRSQGEAAAACGLDGRQAFFRIVFPQAVRIALPTAFIELVGLIQDTSLVFMVGVVDMVGRAQAIANESLHGLEAYAFVALVFVACSVLLMRLSRSIERRLSFGRKTEAGT